MDGDLMTINMGPNHPATHGVLRLKCQTDGEIISGITPVVGYLHRCFEKHSENVTGKSLSLIHSAEARTASCSILEVTKLELDFIPLLNNDLMLQLSASVPPLVNIISFGATSKIDEIISLDSSNIFFAFLDKLCPPEEFANPSCSASIKALIAISRIGVVAAWSR